jgi:hypothetical protein
VALLLMCNEGRNWALVSKHPDEGETSVSKGILFATLLATSALTACESQQTRAPGSTALLESECSEATTGDMYRYCLEVGPQQAIFEPEARSRETAALTSH